MGGDLPADPGLCDPGSNPKKPGRQQPPSYDPLLLWLLLNLLLVTGALKHRFWPAVGLILGHTITVILLIAGSAMRSASATSQRNCVPTKPESTNSSL